MLVTIEQVLTAQEVAHMRELLAGATWVDGRETAGVQAAEVKRNRQVAEEAPALALLRKMILEALGRNGLFFSAALPARILPPLFNRYGGSMNEYGWHVDCSLRRVSQHAGFIRADVSSTIFLSDPSEYEGGELVIEDTFGEHRVKLKAGDAVVYPSSSLHRVAPVTRGERMACFLFIQSLVRDASQRRLLFELDMAAMEIRAKLGEQGAARRLTAIYHNLLRMWAEP